LREHDQFRSHHILVVGDDQTIHTLIMRALRVNGFLASAARDGREMWEVIDGSTIDLVLLDILLSGVNGLDLCRALRARSPLPVIMVTARGEEMDRVIGLEIGADDYIGKPFGEKELLARVRAVLRRGAALEDFPGRVRSDILRFSGWSLHLSRRELLDPSGALVELSGAEHDLLLHSLVTAISPIGSQRLIKCCFAIISCYSAGERQAFQAASERSFSLKVWK
jgi:two-component system OmpR family response regulator